MNTILIIRQTFIKFTTILFRVQWTFPTSLISAHHLPPPHQAWAWAVLLRIFRKETNATWILKYFSGHSFRAAVGCQQNITFGQNLHFSIFLWTLLDLFIFTRVHWILKFRLPHCIYAVIEKFPPGNYKMCKCQVSSAPWNFWNDFFQYPSLFSIHNQ